MKTKVSISVLFCALSVQLSALCDAAPVNLNVKSGLLSRLLGNSTPTKRGRSNGFKDSSSTSSTTAQTTERSKGRVSLDLSGTYHCLVAGPTRGTESGAPIALFNTGNVKKKGWSPPSLVCSLGYNFSQSIYGATRFMTKLSWSYNYGKRDETTFTQQQQQPLTIHIQGEKGLLENDDYAAQVGLSLKSTAVDKLPPSLQIRWQQDSKQVTISTPLHKRIGVVWKSIFPTSQQNDQSSFFSSEPIPPSLQQDWWLPNLRINTNGRLTSDNQVGFALPNNNKSSNKKQHYLGVRLLFSRQLGWSAFGEILDDHLGTVMKLQVTGTNSKHSSFSTVTMESVLEQPLASTQWTLAHEQVH